MVAETMQNEKEKQHHSLVSFPLYGQILTHPVSYYSLSHVILYLRLYNPDQEDLNKALTLKRETSVVIHYVIED